jgi:hypothetical protein
VSEVHFARWAIPSPFARTYTRGREDVMEPPRAIPADVERFEVARQERDRRAGEYRAASGSPYELSAFVELKAAEKELAARGAWLKWTERDF